MPSLQSALAGQSGSPGRTAESRYVTDGNAAREMSYEPEEQNSVGSDLSRFDEEPEVQEARRMEHNEPVRRRRTGAHTAARVKVSPLSLTLAAVAAVLAAVLIYNYMQLTVLSDQIATVRAEYQNISNEGILLKTQYESRYDLSQIEEYALTKLGMTKMDRSQVEYVEIGNPDTIVRTGQSSGQAGLTLRAAFIRRINALLAMLS